MINVQKDIYGARDFLGNPLRVGDKIVYMDLGYRSLKRGTIQKITPKMVIIKPDVKANIRCNEWYRQYHSQVIKL